MSIEFFPIHWTHDDLCAHALKEILVNQKLLLHNQARHQGEIMSALTDLQAKVATAQVGIAKVQTDLAAFVAANSGGASDADLAAIGTQVDAINTGIDALDAVVSPPAAPTA